MYGTREFELVHGHREELLREADRRRVVRELRAARRKEHLRLRGVSRRCSRR